MRKLYTIDISIRKCSLVNSYYSKRYNTSNVWSMSISFRDILISKRISNLVIDFILSLSILSSLEIL